MQTTIHAYLFVYSITHYSLHYSIGVNLTIIPGGAKNVPNTCMRYSAEWSKWISTKAFMLWQNISKYV